MACTELRIETALGNFSALHWASPESPRVLCLHGWLDNAASFIPLGNCLPGLDIVALDLAGHGHSDHRPARARYHLADNLWDVDAVLDSLGWDRCILVGHSLGGAVATLFAAGAPERVEKLIVIDGLGPLAAQRGKTAQRLADSFVSIRGPGGRKRVFKSLDEAAFARNAVSGLPLPLARMIVERSIAETEDGFQWRTDSALNWRSPFLLDEPQVREVIRAIRCPVLALTSSPLHPGIDPETVAGRAAAVGNLVDRRVTGHHHFHMDRATETAGHILEFLDIEGADTA